MAIFEASPTRESDLFKGVSQRVMNDIGKMGEEMTFDEGTTIFKADDDAHFLYELVEGTVDIVISEKENLHFVVDRPGEIFGWSALVEPYVYTGTATCMSKTRVVRLSRDAIENVVKRHPDEGLVVYKHLAGIIAQRLRTAYQYIYKRD